MDSNNEFLKQTKTGKFSSRLSGTAHKSKHEAFRISDSFFRQIIAGLEDYAVFTMDKKGTISSWNSGAFHIFGYTEGEIIGKDVSLIFTPEEKLRYEPEKEREMALKEGRAVDEKWHLRKDGTRFWSNGLTFPLKDEQGNVQGFTKVTRDITKQKQLQQQRDDFMGIVSHELKTPVTSVKAFTQVLQNRFAKAGDEKSSILLGKMDAQLNKLNALIGDLLDVTKIEGGKLQFNEDYFYFDELVEEIVEELQRTTTRHTIEIIGKTKKRVYGDHDRIGQVITNLLTNAIKYSPHSDKVLVRITSNQKNVQLCVQDFGVGIPKEMQPQVFERFYRVSARTHDTVPGIGLGLYIASEIIKRQNGKIWVESEQKKGSTFCFSLPIHKYEMPHVYFYGQYLKDVN